MGVDGDGDVEGDLRSSRVLPRAGCLSGKNLHVAVAVYDNAHATTTLTSTSTTTPANVAVDL